jgi:hypothetical protein
MNSPPIGVGPAGVGPAGVGPANPSGVPEFTPVFCWIRVAQSLALIYKTLRIRLKIE